MIYIGLPFKIVLRSQLRSIADNLRMDYDNLEQVHSYCKYVDYNKVSGKSFYYAVSWEEYKNNIYESDGTDDEKGYIGSTGIINLCNSNNVGVNTIKAIYIPSYLWNCLKIVERKDLTALITEVEKHSDKYRRMIDIGAPDIIIRNEARMLEDAVYRLDDNTGSCLKPKMNDKGHPYLSLKDINFNLSTYVWIDEEEPEDSELRVDNIKVPDYKTPEEVKEQEEKYLSLNAKYAEAEKELVELRKKVIDLEHSVKVEKQKCESIKNERDNTVRALSKENLALDHKVDELVEKIQSITLSRQ